jgi:hypothetical protein
LGSKELHRTQVSRSTVTEFSKTQKEQELNHNRDSLAFAEMRLILSRIVFDFDMQLGIGSHDWIGRQRTYPLWSRMPLNVHCTPVKRD